MSKPKLTPKQMAERRLRRNNVIIAVACPVCLAEVGETCSGSRQFFRLSPHRERIYAARDLNQSHLTRPDSEILPTEDSAAET